MRRQPGEAACHNATGAIILGRPASPGRWNGAGGVMDGLDQRHDRILEKFLAGVLDLADASKWDEHLLECEPCWRAVREDMEARRATTGARLRSGADGLPGGPRRVPARAGSRGRKRRSARACAAR